MNSFQGRESASQKTLSGGVDLHRSNGVGVKDKIARAGVLK